MKPYHFYLKKLGFAVLAVSAFAWTGASAEIELTPHNLGSTGPGPNTFSGTAELCVFCHTPHGGDTSAAVPLWNRTLADPTTYTTYSTTSSTSIDGGVAPVGSVSIACLSCHDGTQAMDTLINTPGSGSVALVGTWTGADRPQGLADIGQNLQNDHPIGVQYGGGGINLTAPTGAPVDPDFVDPENRVINGTTVWWVDTEATPNGTREKTDMQLYTRTVAGVDFAGEPEPFVECGSCHDPHTSTATFLRIANTGSAVCLACHSK